MAPDLIDGATTSRRRRRNQAPRRAGGLAVLLVVALAGCTAPAPAPTPTPSVPATPSPTPTPTPVDPLAGMSLEARVAQLFMVGTSVEGAQQETLDAVADRGVGGIFLHGRSSAGVDATAALVAQFTALVPAGATPLWVATDQEGGDVQVLSGPGFDDIPSALTQAQGGCNALRTSGRAWGSQLAQAGVTVNLAPVADIVTSPETARQNPPIGRLNREYGFDEATVAACAGSFAQGMRVAGVLPTYKHFPGLGRTDQNTDYASGVTDDTIGPSSPDVEVYRTLIAQGDALVMMSTAVYPQIDPGAPAAFSPGVVTGLLRDQLGFDGVVITDDVSAAAQVKGWSPGDRAVLSIRAGVDVVLVSADPTVFAPMYDAVLQTAQSDPAFAAQVDASVRRILELKSRYA